MLQDNLFLTPPPTLIREIDSIRGKLALHQHYLHLCYEKMRQIKEEEAKLEVEKLQLQRCINDVMIKIEELTSIVTPPHSK